ncbi:MAG: efflux RND transporter permease subunit [Parvularculaceae bacterium]
MMNGIVAWWGRNPVAGNLMMLACVVCGLLSYSMMEKEFWPAGRGDVVAISAVWPGASPEDMESQVIVRIEEATADLDGVDWVRSRASEGSGWVNIFAMPGTDVNALTAEVKTRVDAISTLPPGLEPPQVQRQVQRNWSIIMSVHGTAPEKTLRAAAMTLRDRLALVNGGANTIVIGARRPEVSIEVSEDALRRYGLTFDDVSRAVQGTSLNVSSGRVRTDDGDFQLRARNLADTSYDFGAIVIRETVDGGVVRVRDVADVVDGFEDRNVYNRLDDDPSILVSVQTADRFNIWKTSKEVKNVVEEMRGELPDGVGIRLFYDEAEDFGTLTGILFSNAAQGFFLIFILLMFSLHPKVAFWATAGVMTAFAGAFFVLPYAGVSLNFMSVFGFLLVLGIMVDDAIIVGESVYEQAEKRGKGGVETSIIATQLVLKPLIASVLVTMMAFSPWMLISGDARQFTRAISIVVMSTLVFSLIESLLILPAHLAHVEPAKTSTSLIGRLMSFQRKCADSVLWVANKIHKPMLRGAVNHRYLTLAVFGAIFVMTIGYMASGRIKQTFMPEVEGDFMQVSIELPQSTPFERMREVAEQLNAARRQLETETADLAAPDPNTGTNSNGVVRSWAMTVDENTVRAWVALTPPESRDLRSKKIAERAKELLGDVPDAERIGFDLSGNNNGPAIQIAVIGENQEDLSAAVEDLKAKLLTYSSVRSVRDSEEAANEELRLKLKPGAERLGVSLAALSNQVRQAYFGEEAQRLPRDGDDVRVYVRYPEEARRSLSSLEEFRVRTADGREIPLSAVAEMTFEEGVTGLDRRQRQRSIMVEAEADREARGDIMRELEESYFPQFDARYPTVSRRDLGEAESQQEFMAEIFRLLTFAFFGMYALLAIVFRSYAQPALIMSAIPFALVGAIIGHGVFGTAFGLFSYLGAIAAMGVVVNDNVVLIDKMNQFRDEGENAFSAALDAGVSRFRQIFLTSVTEFIGLAPMIFEQAAIAQFLKPMALSLAFGVLFCMPVTLILSPCLYLIGKDVKDNSGKLWRFWRRGWSREAQISPAE